MGIMKPLLSLQGEAILGQERLQLHHLWKEFQLGRRHTVVSPSKFYQFGMILRKIGLNGG